jgi:hypothetical protein
MSTTYIFGNNAAGTLAADTPKGAGFVRVRTSSATAFPLPGTNEAFAVVNVVNVATDLDAIYRNKYPHKGEGAIKSTGTNWRDTFDESLGNLIAGAYPLYMQTFSY